MNARFFWPAFVLCAFAAAAPLLITHRLPMADLPEHAAQVAILSHYHDACHRFAESFELNFTTPYLLGYLVANAFATVVDVNTAMKLTVYLAIVLLPLALRYLLRAVGGDPWLALLGIPLAFGFSFYWGFLNFLLALPIAVLHIAVAYQTSVLPARRCVLTLFALSLLLLAGHGLLLVICALVAIAMAVASGSWHRAAAVTIPVAVAVALAGWWALAVQQAEQAVHNPPAWHLGWYRLRDFPSTLFGAGWSTSATLFFAALVLAIALTAPRVSSDPRRWIPLALLSALYLFGPISLIGSTFLFQRTAPLVVAAAFVLLGEPRRRAGLGRMLLVSAVVAWMAILTARFSRFDQEARGFDELVDRMPAGRRVLQFQVDPFSSAVPGPVFLHFGAWYQARKGGLVAWSFASFYPQLVRYRPGAEPRLRSRPVPRLGGIDWQGVAQYDYIIVRSPVDVGPRLFADAPYAIRPRERRDDWWLYETPRARLPTQPCGPLEVE